MARVRSGVLRVVSSREVAPLRSASASDTNSALSTFDVRDLAGHHLDEVRSFPATPTGRISATPVSGEREKLRAGPDDVTARWAGRTRW